jgi:hypothetical protein
VTGGGATTSGDSPAQHAFVVQGIAETPLSGQGAPRQ